MRYVIGNGLSFERKPLRVTIWNEYVHEKTDPQVARIYPKGIHTALAQGLQPYGFLLRTATLEQPEHGLTREVLDETDVLIWWGHLAHERVSDAVVARIHARVLQGMGLIVLHSGHRSRIFQRLMGTTCDLKWREDAERERLWVVDPAHPIVEGIGEYIELEPEEMYGEFFDIPAPERLVFISWFQGGKSFAADANITGAWGKSSISDRGMNHIPTYYNRQVLRVIANAVRYVGAGHGALPVFGETKPLERRC